MRNVEPDIFFFSYWHLVLDRCVQHAVLDLIVLLKTPEQTAPIYNKKKRKKELTHCRQSLKFLKLVKRVCGSNKTVFTTGYGKIGFIVRAGRIKLIPEISNCLTFEGDFVHFMLVIKPFSAQFRGAYCKGRSWVSFLILRALMANIACHLSSSVIVKHFLLWPEEKFI